MLFANYELAIVHHLAAFAAQMHALQICRILSN